jgi:hypothetical protein
MDLKFFTSAFLPTCDTESVSSFSSFVFFFFVFCFLRFGLSDCATTTRTTGVIVSRESKYLLWKGVNGWSLPFRDMEVPKKLAFGASMLLAKMVPNLHLRPEHLLKLRHKPPTKPEMIGSLDAVFLCSLDPKDDQRVESCPELKWATFEEISKLSTTDKSTFEILKAVHQKTATLFPVNIITDEGAPFE